MRNIVPQVTFKTRVRDESVGGDNPYRWQDVTSDDYFKNKRVVIFTARSIYPSLLNLSSTRV